MLAFATDAARKETEEQKIGSGKRLVVRVAHSHGQPLAVNY